MAKPGYWSWSAAALGAASSGNPTLTTSHDVTCSGLFACLTAEEARGTVDCSGGQGDPFEPTRTGDRWAGEVGGGYRRVPLELDQ
jgi:hypothetical protein